MFCSNCGKEVKETEIYCHHCGYHLKGENTAPVIKPTDNNGDTSYLVAIALANIFVAISIFYKTMHCIFTDYHRKLSVFDMFDFVDYLDNWGFEINHYTAIKIFGVGAVISGILSMIFGAVFLFSVYKKEARKKINISQISSFWGLLGILLQGISVKLLNACDDVGIMELTLFRFTVWSWFVIVIALVNIFLLSKLYTGSSSPVSMRSKEYSEKTCMICKTTYSIGNKCPNCGSTSTV